MPRGSTLEVVRPRHLWIPDRAGSFGSLAVEVAELAGIELDPEQKLALDAILSIDPVGAWSTLEAALIEPRQNGKTRLFQVVALYDLFVAPRDLVRLVVWTAHLFDTSQEAFRDLDEILSGTPYFARKVARVSKAHGKEAFELKDGRRIRFRARSETGGRGLTGDRVVLDEAFALKAGELGSLLPTLSARPNPQVLYGSSAGMVGSGHLRTVRDRGRAGGDPSLVWAEWCGEPGECQRGDDCDHRPGAPGCVLDDEDRWRQANPALGRRITIEYLRSERRALPPNEFARERLGWWEDPVDGGTGWTEEQWAACANPDAPFPDPVVLGLDVAPGHVSAAITAHSGRVTHLADHHRGTSWILGTDEDPGRLLELDAEHQVVAVVIDPTGPVGGMIPDLERAGFSVRSKANPKGKLVLLDGREQTQACEQLLAGVIDGTFVHRGEYALDTAALNAGRRKAGDSFKWSRLDSTVDISPLVAATCGSFEASKPAPKKPRSIAVVMGGAGG
jgi:hypothetical protein